MGKWLSSGDSGQKSSLNLVFLSPFPHQVIKGLCWLIFPIISKADRLPPLRRIQAGPSRPFPPASLLQPPGRSRWLCHAPTTVYSQHRAKEILWKSKADHIAPLLKTGQWLLIHPREEAQVCTMAPFLLWPLPVFSPLDYPTLALPASLLLLQDPDTFLSQGLCTGCFLCPDCCPSKCPHGLLTSLLLSLFSNVTFSLTTV